MLDEKIKKYVEVTLRTFKLWDDMRDSGLSVPDGIKTLYNIGYKDELLLDIYYPKNTTAPLQTIISVHGGAYVYGDKDRYRFYCMSLAERGFAVVNFNYRLAPDSVYPAPLEDLNDLLWWIYRNSGEYLIDTDKLYIVGDSAGAQISSQYLAMLTNSSYGSLFGMEFPPLSVKACALNCGMYDMKKLVFREERMELFDAYFQGHHDEYKAQLDVLTNITKNFPPAYIMTSYYDFLKDEAKPFADKLESLGVPCRFVVYGNENDRHMSHVFHLNMKISESALCNDDECRFFGNWR